MDVIKYIMKTTNEGAVNLALFTQDVEDERPIKNAIIELWIENHQQPLECLTNEQGRALIRVKHFGVHVIRILKSGYVAFEQKIFFTKGFCAEKQQVSLSINMVKNSPRYENTGFIVLNGHEDFSGRLVITDQSN
mmetsp:Transcript_22206/g.21432  ORF Transcript_22206/g.21432 Transcript_22206/m.21432 type:complete len:135 (+) Transcript_22206:568-972(+)